MVAAIVWGIKSSFLEYAEAMEATIRTTGVERTERGFRFPREELSRSTATLAFTGEVQIEGYGGLMNVKFHSPRIVHQSGDWMLAATTEFGEVMLAKLVDFPSDGLGEGESVVVDAVELTSEAAHILGGVYRPGESADPLIVEG